MQKEQEIQSKISDFVTHLMSNPNLKTEPVLQVESIVLNFVVQNIDKLKITFQSPQFFPELSIKDVLSYLVAELKNRTISNVLPAFKIQIEKMDFSFLSSMNSRNTFDNAYIRDIFKNYISEIVTIKEVRQNLNAAYNILQNDILERYVSSSFTRRSPLYFELVRVQKNNLRAEEYVNYLKTLLLIRSAAYVKEEIPDFSDSKVNIIDFMKIPKTLTQYFKKKSIALRKSLPCFPADIIEMGLKSNVSTAYLETEDTSAKFLFILATRYQSYQEYKKIDRGAETPDKSWFGIMRKNAAHYGFDKRILEDLYMIAGDNNW